MEKTALPEDVVLEILARVADAADLFRCATACKRWRALVADPAFLRRRWPEPAAARQPSFLFAAHTRRSEGWYVRPTTLRLLAPVGPGSRRFAAFSVRRSLDGAMPLASRSGLLLVRLNMDPRNPGVLRLAVCDPLSDACHVLPPLHINAYFHVRCCAVLTDADCNPTGRQRPPLPDYPFFFKVAIVGHRDKPEFNISTFSSAEPRWSTAMRRFNDQTSHMVMAGQDSAAVCQGAAHWLFRGAGRFYTLDMSAETGDFSMTRLPVASTESSRALQLGVGAEGRLSLLRLRGERLQVQIWTRQLGTTGWQYPREIDLTGLNREDLPTEESRLLCLFVCDRTAMALITDHRRCVYVADFETGAMEAQMSGNVPCSSVVTFDMDWPVFFLSRLATN